MFFEAKVTKIYCLADDFCKEFAKHQEYYMLKNTKKNVKHHNKPNRMSDAEIILIIILFHSEGYRCFKHFYQEYICKHLVHPFPERVSYNRFVELEKDVFFPLTIFTRRSRDWPHVENVLMNINDKILIRKGRLLKL